MTKPLEDFEIPWYFEDREELEFWKWCFINRKLLELLKKPSFGLLEAIDTEHQMVKEGSNPDAFLAMHIFSSGYLEDSQLKTERCMYSTIQESIGGVILGGPNQPDLVVGGIPIEAKKNEFNHKALLQLQRYMKAMKADFGIAAAPLIDIELPKNIFFLQVIFDREKDVRSYVVKNKEACLQFLDSIKSSVQS